MFLALGLPWIFENIHYSLHRNHEHAEDCIKSPTEILFRLLSILYYSRGTLLFFIFVCKRSVWLKLKRTDPIKRLTSKIDKRKKRAVYVKSELTFISMTNLDGNGHE